MLGWRQKATRLIGDIKEEYSGECRFVKLRALIGGRNESADLVALIHPARMDDVSQIILGICDKIKTQHRLRPGLHLGCTGNLWMNAAEPAGSAAHHGYLRSNHFSDPGSTFTKPNI